MPRKDSFSNRQVILKITIPRVAHERDFFALVQGTEGEVDIKLPIGPDASLIQDLAGRESAYFSAILQPDGGVVFGWECSLWFPTIKHDDMVDSTCWAMAHLSTRQKSAQE